MNQPNEILLYKNQAGDISLDVLLEDDTVWLTQLQISALFNKAKSTVSEHIKNIFDDDELDKISVVRHFRTTAKDGKKYDTAFYNLDVIISVGYRVKSLQGTQFRIWATQRLKDHIVKGFTLNDDRFKNALMNYALQEESNP